MYDREREKHENFPLDLADAMQKMLNAELISKAVKHTSQTRELTEVASHKQLVAEEAGVKVLRGKAKVALKEATSNMILTLTGVLKCLITTVKEENMMIMHGMSTTMKKMMAAISALIIMMMKKTKTIVTPTMTTTSITATPILTTKKIINMKNKYLNNPMRDTIS
jgi:hypothetical protein